MAYLLIARSCPIKIELLSPQKLSFARRAATVSVAKFALPGSITCRSAVKINQGATAKLY
jgi:hypothetical protein